MYSLSLSHSHILADKNISVAGVFGFLVPVTASLSSVWPIPFIGVFPYFAFVLIAILTKSREFSQLKSWISLYLLLSVFILVNVISSRAQLYGLQKSLYVLFFYFVFGVALLVSLKTVNLNLDFLKGLTWGSVVSLLLGFVVVGNPFSLVSSLGKWDRIVLGNQNPIIWAQAIGLGIVLFVWYMVGSRKARHIVVSLVLIIVSLAFMILTGSKGPLVGLGLALLVFIVFVAKTRSMLLLPVLVLVGMFVNSFVLSALPQDFVSYRFDIVQSESVDSRVKLIGSAIEAYTRLDFVGLLAGGGTGDFSVLWSHQDARMYPHSVFVEMLYEEGAVGLLLYVICILLPLISVFRFLRKTENTAIPGELRTLIGGVLALYVYSIGVAQFTGDVSFNWYTPLFCFLLLTTLQSVQSHMRTLADTTSSTPECEFDGAQ